MFIQIKLQKWQNITFKTYKKNKQHNGYAYAWSVYLFDNVNQVAFTKLDSIYYSSYIEIYS